MATTKTTTLMLRLDPAVKQGLRLIAARERRSLANMIEVMIRDYGQQHGIAIPEAQPMAAEMPAGPHRARPTTPKPNSQDRRGLFSE